MPEPRSVEDGERKSRILAILDENRVMTIATVRPDGWPQATVVGYVHEELTLYFVVARTSQKLANIERDHRVSIAIGHDSRDHLRGLSMAAHASLVKDAGEIDRLNSLIHKRYPGEAVFAPRSGFAAILRATPVLISLVDLSKGWGEPDLLEVGADGALHDAAPDTTGHA